MKLAFGMIVFEGDYVLQECLEQVYPYASQILIAEGPVTFWQNQGRTTSLDDTNKILDEFPDPENKSEKDEQCRAYMDHINDDIDYIWNLDSDELFKSEDIEKVIDFLKRDNPTSVGVRSCSFYGGFDHYLTGFELNRDNFLRVFKYEAGAHEFKPESRGDCFTDKFSLEHPLSIQKNMASLKEKLNEQLKNYV